MQPELLNCTAQGKQAADLCSPGLLAVPEFQALPSAFRVEIPPWHGDVMAVVMQQVATGTGAWCPAEPVLPGGPSLLAVLVAPWAPPLAPSGSEGCVGKPVVSLYQRLWCFVINPPVFLPPSNLNRLRDTEQE